MPAVICEPQATITEGLAAIPETWIPTGVRFCYLAGPWGGCTGLVSRTPISMEIRFQHMDGPSIVCTDLVDGRVQVVIEGAARRMVLSGAFAWASDHAHFEDPTSGSLADLYRSLDGKLVLEIRSGDRCPTRYHLLF